MATERNVKPQLLIDCTFALVVQDEDLLGMRVESRDVAMVQTRVAHFLLTKELAMKMHEQLGDVLGVTKQ